jgi:hypothetical protein
MTDPKATTEAKAQKLETINSWSLSVSICLRNPGYLLESSSARLRTRPGVG